MGAAYYTIERADQPDGPWKPVATGLHDSVIEDAAAFEPTERALLPLELWFDATSRKGDTRYYRIRGANGIGCERVVGRIEG
jgi:hypothetical protein